MRRRNVRWVCPTEGCLTPTVLAPSRPRSDDVRRFCLECSDRTGRLVRRVPPALVKEREAKKVRAAEKRIKLIAQSRERAVVYHTVAGVNLLEEMRRLIHLPVFKGTGLRCREPRLNIHHRTVRPNRYGCAQYGKWTIIIADYPGIDEHVVRDTLVHELAHLACPGAGHGVRWKTTYRLACEQAFGIRPRVENRFIHETTEKLRDAAATRFSSVSTPEE
jgi:hypothetical protein